MQKLKTGAAYQFTPADTTSENSPTVLIVHGWKATCFTGQTYFDLALRLQAIGYNTLHLSLRGHQGADGSIETVTRQEHLEDIAAAIAYLDERPKVGTGLLCGFGASYGAYLLSCVPESFQLLALRAPALYPDTDWESPSATVIARPNRMEWRSTVRTTTESRALTGIGNFFGDLLIVGSGSDEDIPVQVLESYATAAKQVKSLCQHVIPGANHSLHGGHREQFLDIAGDWFKKKVVPSAQTSPLVAS